MLMQTVRNLIICSMGKRTVTEKWRANEKERIASFFFCTTKCRRKCLSTSPGAKTALTELGNLSHVWEREGYSLFLGLRPTSGYVFGEFSLLVGFFVVVVLGFFSTKKQEPGAGIYLFCEHQHANWETFWVLLIARITPWGRKSDCILHKTLITFVGFVFRSTDK